MAECIIKYGDDAFELIGKYGDDAVDAIITYGDDAVDALIKYGDDAAAAIGMYGDDAMDVIGKYGDDAVEGLKNGRTPDEIRMEYEGSTGGSGVLSDERIEFYLGEGMHYENSDTVILGLSGKYDIKGEDYTYTYFKMEDEIWAQLEAETMEDYDEMWKVNKQFLDNQIETGKRILLSDDPYKGYYLDNGAKRFYQRELDYLEELGYTFQSAEDGLWEAVKK